MRESRTYGSVRGACDETHVPTATTARVHQAARRRGSRMAARGAGADLGAPCVAWVAGNSHAGVAFAKHRPHGTSNIRLPARRQIATRRQFGSSAAHG